MASPYGWSLFLESTLEEGIRLVETRVLVDDISTKGGCILGVQTTKSIRFGGVTSNPHQSSERALGGAKGISRLHIKRCS